MAAHRFAPPALSALLFAASALPAAEGPTAVSPGRTESAVAIEGRCPTFSWSHLTEADRFELAVYRLGTNGVERVLHESLTGGARSWTPSLDHCLDAPGPFGWAVRSERAGTLSEWSAPMLFEVPETLSLETPSLAEVEAAIALLQRFRDTIRPRDATRSPSDRSASPQMAAPGLDVAPADADIERSPTLPTEHSLRRPSGVGLPSSELRVSGEVRTVDAQGEPRSWGKGRPGLDDVYGLLFGPCSSGGLKFGLSKIFVDWGSAADACPAGTWVCSDSDLIGQACNTGRPDGALDAIACAGTPRDYASNEHWGWVSDRAEDTLGALHRETGSTGAALTCDAFPVWCCWEE